MHIHNFFKIIANGKTGNTFHQEGEIGQLDPLPSYIFHNLCGTYYIHFVSTQKNSSIVIKLTKDNSNILYLVSADDCIFLVGELTSSQKC